MRKVLSIVSVIVVVAAILVSCSQGGLVDNQPTESETEQEATTVIVDEEGTTHYYKFVSDNSQGSDSTTVLAEIATDKNGEPITNRSGEYVTTEYTTIITPETTTTANDNDVPFDSPDEESATGNNETTETETIPDSPTDSDGWINRWY